MFRGRGFEVVKRLEGTAIQLPKRGSKNSAGYDFFALEDVVVPVSRQNLYRNTFEPVILKTGIKVFMPSDEWLMLVNRSSIGIKKGLIMPNSLGVIDADYYNNPDNDGEICFAFINFSDCDFTFKKGDRIGQGIFMKFLDCGDYVDVKRTGGIGSTGN